VPAAPTGLQAEDPTIAELLKPLGYATGQFGKNHLGDKNEFLPTVHGFDEFFGNLYHLNAEEDPESPNYPPPEDFPHFRERFGPRGVLRSKATNKDDAKEHERWGRVGKQRIEDTGPLTKKRMETCDDEFVAAACDFIERQHRRRKPFFCWVNTTHMHFRTHTKRRSLGQAGRWQSPYHDTMIDHDKHVGQLLDLLDKLGIAENTIVVYSTDNGPHMNTWPDGGMTPFRSEKNTNWEGAFRIPELVRWPGKIPAGVVSNEIIQHHDWLPTFLAAAGEPDIVEKLKAGHTIGDLTYKVHIDGYNLLPYLTGEVDKSPRQGFIYFSDDGDVLGIRFDNWKVVFMEQRVQGTMQIWAEPFVPLRLPKPFNLRTDPFERADVTSNTYWDWFAENGVLVFAASAVVGQFPSRSSRRVRRRPASRSTRRSPSWRLRSPAARRSVDPSIAGHGLGPSREVSDGIGRALPGGGPRAHGRRGRFLDRQVPGDEPAVRRLRRRRRPRHRGRAAARPGRLPRRTAWEPRTRVAGVHDDGWPRRPPPPQPMVDVDARRLLEPPGRPVELA
jgi:arylsulfatase